MTAIRTSECRLAFAALLILVLAFAGVGSNLVASAAAQSYSFVLNGAAPICHSGDASRESPAGPGETDHRDRCDQCALCAPLVFSAAPEIRTVPSASHELVRSADIAWTVRLSRARSPKQSQGPPAA